MSIISDNTTVAGDLFFEYVSSTPSETEDGGPLEGYVNVDGISSNHDWYYGRSLEFGRIHPYGLPQTSWEFAPLDPDHINQVIRPGVLGYWGVTPSLGFSDPPSLIADPPVPPTFTAEVTGSGRYSLVIGVDVGHLSGHTVVPADCTVKWADEETAYGYTEVPDFALAGTRQLTVSFNALGSNTIFDATVSGIFALAARPLARPVLDGKLRNRRLNFA